MATLNGEITRIENDKAAIKAAIEAKGGAVGESLDTYAEAIANLATGGGGDFGTITIQNEDNTTTELPLDLSGFLGLSYTLSDGPTLVVNGNTYHKNQVISYDTGDNLDTILPSMFNGQEWDEEAGEDSYYFKNLKTVRLGAKITNVPANFLAANIPVENLTLVAVKTIGDNFFSGNRVFNSSFTLPPTLTTIGNSFMAGATAFAQSLTIPAAVTNVGSSFLYNAQQFTTLVAEAAATIFAPNDTSSLATYDQSAPEYATGITITGAGASHWMAAFPNRKTSPYRNIVGNPQPEPYLIYTTNDEVEHEVYDEYQATAYLTGYAYNHVPNDTTKISIKPAASQLSITRINTGWPYVEVTSNQAGIQEVTGLEHLTAVSTIANAFLEGYKATSGELQLPPNLETVGSRFMVEPINWTGAIVLNSAPTFTPAKAGDRSLAAWGPDAPCYVSGIKLRGDAEGIANLQAAYPNAGPDYPEGPAPGSYGYRKLIPDAS